jgi:hypothetical protein
MAVHYEVGVWLTQAPSCISPIVTWDLWWINLGIIVFNQLFHVYIWLLLPTVNTRAESNHRPTNKMRGVVIRT